MTGSAVLVTPGHCGSSLGIWMLGQDGYEVGPPGRRDNRHPLGHYDWMNFIQPQIDNNWSAYLRAITEQKNKPFAFKFQSGVIHWGMKAFEPLPKPVRVVLLHRRENREKVNLGGKQFHEDYKKALGPFLAELAWAGHPVETWIKEEICAKSRTGS